MVGGTLTVSLVEDSTPEDDKDLVMAEISGEGTPSERLLRLKLGVKWEVGEAGEGGGWKNGQILDSSDLILVGHSAGIAHFRYRINCPSRTYSNLPHPPMARILRNTYVTP